MRPICALCGRPTTPFVMIGREAVGPKCTARAGLTPTKTPKGSHLRFLKTKPVRETAQQTLDPFQDHEPN